MSDNIRMDSHKLIFHPDVVSKWLGGEEIYPLSVEVGLSNVCNHRCIFCAVDYSEYKGKFIDKEIILSALKTLSEKGAKSVVFSGEGEPLLHKDAALIINKTKSYGLDAALSTNGVLFDEAVARECLQSLTWIRFSVSASTPETYAKIHQTKEADFHTALKNIKNAVSVKKEGKLGVTIGVQLLLLPENIKEAVSLAEILRDIGVDYFTIKPYSEHPDSINDNRPDYVSMNAEIRKIEVQLRDAQKNDYKVFFRAGQMEKLAYNRPYKKCCGMDFMCHIDSQGDVIPCIMYFGNPEYRFGNLYDSDIVSIWESRHKVCDKINATELKGCREICRLNEMNIYLNELMHPGAHVNFV